jgi:O-succinylbenzoate synthase
MRLRKSANKMETPIAFRRYRLPFRASVRTAHGPWAEREGLYVRIGGPGGAAGYGEASPVPHFGPESVAAGEAFLTSLGGRAAPDLLSRVPAGLASLRGALAAALGKGAGPPRHESLSVAALLPAGRAALREGPLRAQDGFRTFKWKVAVGEAREEMAILDDLVGALPGGSRLRLDANGGWDARTAGRWLDRASGLPVEFVEQPIAPGARGADDALSGLSADYPVPVALDESVACDADALRWLDSGWRGFFVIKAALIGDAEGTLGRLARAGARVVFSSALETGIGARSALRAAFAWPGERLALGFGAWPLFADSRFDGPAAAPFVRREDAERIDPEALWNAVS